MQFRKILFGLIMIAVCFASVIMTQSPVSAKSEKQIKVSEVNNLVKYRKLFMEVKNQHNVAIKRLTREMPVSASERASQIVTHADALNKMASDMLRLFPEGTSSGKSRAEEGIWDKDGKLTADFVSLAGTMQNAANKLAIAAREGRMDTIVKEVRELARSCRGCHSEFRAE